MQNQTSSHEHSNMNYKTGGPIYRLPYSSDQLMLSLAQAQDTQELDDLLEAFFSAEFVDFLSRHSGSLMAHSLLWSAMIRRIVFSSKDVRFPNKLLLLPPIYHQLGWTSSAGDEWASLRSAISDEFTLRPMLPHAMLLLFLDGMSLSLEEATFLFQGRLAFLNGSSNEFKQGEGLLEELSLFGWPTAGVNHSNMQVTMQ